MRTKIKVSKKRFHRQFFHYAVVFLFRLTLIKEVLLTTLSFIFISQHFITKQKHVI